MSGTRLKERGMLSSVFTTISGDDEVFYTWFILDAERLFAVLEQIKSVSDKSSSVGFRPSIVMFTHKSHHFS